MSTDDRGKRAARADLARLLSACFYEPGPEFVEERVFDALRESASMVDAGLADAARRVGAAFAASSVDDLLVDYTRLFLGPVDARARPYGSVWLDRRQALMGDSTMDLLRQYREAGFDVDAAFRDLPDHVAVELEFLYLLLYREAEAGMRADGPALAAAVERRLRFLRTHLGAWIAPFAAAVRAGAQTDYYRELAALTQRFVVSDVARGTG
ncbi:MAG: hypothetical protein BroJett026_18170 [Betaproteobacteria bacterium]|nr:MAG: hypothetical protein BroJett026_18170 [Betaproteobacteria bacterium]